MAPPDKLKVLEELAQEKQAVLQPVKQLPYGWCARLEKAAAEQGVEIQAGTYAPAWNQRFLHGHASRRRRSFGSPLRRHG